VLALYVSFFAIDELMSRDEERIAMVYTIGKLRGRMSCFFYSNRASHGEGSLLFCTSSTALSYLGKKRKGALK
jgi:hypothetical protein